MNPDPNKPRPGHLPRLPREYYQGNAMVHWTQATFDRVTGWLSETFHARFRELMLHAAARDGLLCPTYCLMPDHLHLVWMGLRQDSDQKNGMSFLRTYLEPALVGDEVTSRLDKPSSRRALQHASIKFQPQPHDNVLRQPEREHNAFAKVCFYILDNPVKAKLVVKPEDWKYSGAVIPGYPTLHPLTADFWEKFWRLYAQAFHPDAGDIRRPPF